MSCEYEGVSISFRTGRLERELQMVQLSATRCSCIAILWVSRVSSAATAFCVASERVFIVTVLYFVIDSVRKLLNSPSYVNWIQVALDRLQWQMFINTVIIFWIEKNTRKLLKSWVPISFSRKTLHHDVSRSVRHIPYVIKTLVFFVRAAKFNWTQLQAWELNMIIFFVWIVNCNNMKAIYCEYPSICSRQIKQELFN
jgi:hypothetical protein